MARSNRDQASGSNSGSFCLVGFVAMATPRERYPDELKAFHEAAGEVIREWAELEEMLIFHVSALLRTDQFRSQVIWNSLATGRPRFRFLRRLSETFLGEQAAEKFRAMLKRCERIASNRNMLAHAHGGIGERVGTIVFVWDDEDDELGFNFLGNQTVQIGNIRAWARDIVQVRNDLMNFLPEMRASLYASPRMHRVQPDHRPETTDPDPSESTPEGPPRQLGSWQVSLRFRLNWGAFLTQAYD
jgi:hypothetical protein